MITYTEKPGLADALSAAGLVLYQLDGLWITDKPEEVQAFIDAYVTPTAVWLAPINARAAAMLAVVKAGIPQDEIESWGKQEQEARAGGGPLTDALAMRRGIDPLLLRSKIIAKADAYAVYSGDVIGLRQALEDRVMGGEQGVVWPD